jgi:hypothetical protein
MDCKYSVLDTQNSIPTYCFKEARKIFPNTKPGKDKKSITLEFDKDE